MTENHMLLENFVSVCQAANSDNSVYCIIMRQGKFIISLHSSFVLFSFICLGCFCLFVYI